MEEAFLINAKSTAFAIPFPKIMCFESLPGGQNNDRGIFQCVGGLTVRFYFDFILSVSH